MIVKKMLGDSIQVVVCSNDKNIIHVDGNVDPVRDIEIIKLHGSIELAPIIGMSDVIVDIVETGKTLEENNMCVLKEMFPISTRLVANKSSYKFKNDEILTLVERFKLRG